MVSLTSTSKNSCSPNRQNVTQAPIQWAASAKWFHGIQRLKWLIDQDLAIEYTPAADDLAGMKHLLRPFIDQKVPFRFHAFFPGNEFGDEDMEKSRLAMALHKQMIEAVGETYPQTCITCHIGLGPDCRIDKNRVADNLSILVQRARELGLTLTIENLKSGVSSDPFQILEWANAADAAITMDLGHALSSCQVRQGTIDIDKIIDLFSPRLVEAHYYERETTDHHRPEDMHILGPVVDHLLAATQCRWWTIELETHEDILHTRQIALDYLTSKMVSDHFSTDTVSTNNKELFYATPADKVAGHEYLND